MSQRNTILLRLAIILHLISYFLPFLGNDLGYEFFKAALYSFVNQHVSSEEMPIFIVFVSPILALPFFSWACLREAIASRWKLEFSLFTIFLFIPVLLTAFFVFTKSSALQNNFSGYAMWLISFALLFIIYIQKLRKTKNQDEDISRHLIEHD